MTLVQYTSVKIRENRDPLIDLAVFGFVLEPRYFQQGLAENSKMFIRREIAAKLERIQEKLKKYRFKIWDGHRSREVQNNIYKKYGFSGISRCNTYLGSGCYHGVTEEMFLTQGMQSMKEIERDCQKVSGGTAKEAYCLHGVGHGLLTWTAYKLPAALDGCDNFSEAHRGYCYDGVFMDYGDNVAKSQFDFQHPWKLCNELSQPEQKKVCAGALPDTLNKKMGFDIKAFAIICEQAPDKTLQESCIEHLAVKYARQVNGDSKRIIAGCRRIPLAADQTECMIDAVTLLRVERYQDWPRKSEYICKKVPPDSYNLCLENTSE